MVPVREPAIGAIFTVASREPRAQLRLVFLRLKAWVRFSVETSHAHLARLVSHVPEPAVIMRNIAASCGLLDTMLACSLQLTRCHVALLLALLQMVGLVHCVLARVAARANC